MNRIFLLSPAFCGGRRARILLSASAAFPLAVRIRGPEGAPLGEVFTFLSGLYFRGKLAYSSAFARPPIGVPGALVITPCEGLRRPDEPVTISKLEEFAGAPIAKDDGRYRGPLVRDVERLTEGIGPFCDVVLLGSVATEKYLDVLSRALGDRLRFPAAFVGRGDMSRGGLMLRSVDERRELEYVTIDGTPRHGPRPPRLPARRVRTQA